MFIHLLQISGHVETFKSLNFEGLKKLITLLKPFQTATKLLSSDQTPLSVVHPTQHMLLKGLQEFSFTGFKTSTTSTLRKVRDAIMDDLASR